MSMTTSRNLIQHFTTLEPMEVQESSNTEETKKDEVEPALEKQDPAVEELNKDVADVDGAPEAPEDDKMEDGNDDKAEKDEDEKMDDNEKGNFDDEVISSQCS